MFYHPRYRDIIVRGLYCEYIVVDEVIGKLLLVDYLSSLS